MYRTLAKEILDDCILPAKKNQLEQIRRNDCRYDLMPIKRKISSHVHAVLFIKSMINNNLDYSMKSFAVLNCCACAARRIAAMIFKFNFSSKSFNKKLLKIFSMDQCPNTDELLTKL